MKIIPRKNDCFNPNYDFSGEVTIVYPMLHVKTQSKVRPHQGLVRTLALNP
jgi:hypothetical protein